MNIKKRPGWRQNLLLEKQIACSWFIMMIPTGIRCVTVVFFTYVNTTDSVVINSLLHDLEQPFEKANEVKECRSEGKIYLLGRQESLKTIYFSTRGDSCTYLYFIKDGAFFYFPLSENFKSILAIHRNKALKP